MFYEESSSLGGLLADSDGPGGLLGGLPRVFPLLVTNYWPRWRPLSAPTLAQYVKERKFNER